ncbi:plasmid mobilization relaxosome protein MobC [Myroides odoratimimus]|uniref:plasmid mobilization relaxosome protein MobC n=1 Tax=Myroides odoratimimus TaxID=76832 RepID=UPI000469ABF4|nr:plasmid mobilization relaxosome protein MobC [Myroides odoratimimus]
MKKNNQLLIRISDTQKVDWKQEADKNGMTLTEYITHKVEGNLGKNERKQILKSIEISTNVDSKVENNINQIAKWVNTHKEISSEKMNEYLDQLNKYQQLIKERNTIFRKIILLLSKI